MIQFYYPVGLKIIYLSFIEMKFTLCKDKNPAEYWNGKDTLPNEINVMSFHPVISEFELLSIICALHGYLTAFDIMTGADSDTEKDKDIAAAMTAFQMYLYPRMPLSNYGGNDKRMKSNPSLRSMPIDPNVSGLMEFLKI